MALTISKVFSKPVPEGDRWLNVVKVDFDSSYPTGGEPLTRADLGFMSAADDEFHAIAISKSGYVFHYDHTNQKLIAYYGDNNNASDGPLIEVPDTTDLSSITGVRVMAWGRYRG